MSKSLSGGLSASCTLMSSGLALFLVTAACILAGCYPTKDLANLEFMKGDLAVIALLDANGALATDMHVISRDVDTEWLLHGSTDPKLPVGARLNALPLLVETEQAISLVILRRDQLLRDGERLCTTEERPDQVVAISLETAAPDTLSTSCPTMSRQVSLRTDAFCPVMTPSRMTAKVVVVSDDATTRDVALDDAPAWKQIAAKLAPRPTPCP